MPFALSEALYQQGTGSHWDRMTYSKVWNTAHTRTLTIYSVADEAVQPMPFVGTLSGGTPNTVASIQTYCPAYAADHFLMVIAHPAFELTARFLATGTIPSKAQFNPARCITYSDGSITDFSKGVPLASAVLSALITLGATYKAQGEPRFPPYVCAAGAAKASECGNGYFPPALVPGVISGLA